MPHQIEFTASPERIRLRERFLVARGKYANFTGSDTL